MRVTSCATLGFSAFPLETALKNIAKLGFWNVELTELGAYCRHLPYGKTDVGKVRSLLREYGLTAVAMNISTAKMKDGAVRRFSMADSRDVDYIVDYVKWYIEIAVALGVRLLMIPIGPREMRDSLWRNTAEAVVPVLSEVVAQGEAAGVTICLEAPHLFLLNDSVEHTTFFLDRFADTNLGVTVDTSHWGIIGYDIESYLSLLGGRLHHVHLRDSAGNDTRDFKQSLELTPGSGTVDFGAFGAALDDSGYSGEVSLEFEYRVKNEDTILRQYREGIRYLRRQGWRFPESV